MPSAAGWLGCSMHALSAHAGLPRGTAVIATTTEKTRGSIGANELTRSGIGFSLADGSSLWRRERAKHAASSRILSFWCNNAQQVWRDKAQLRPLPQSPCRTLQLTATVPTLSDANWSGAIRSAAPCISRYSPLSPNIHRIRNMPRNVGVGHDFPFLLCSRTLPAAIVGNFALTNFLRSPHIRRSRIAFSGLVRIR
jgi:hypothetical protein